MESSDTRSDTPSPPPVGFLVDPFDEKEISLFPQRGFNLDNPHDIQRRASSRSSSNTRPTSATITNPDEESVEEKLLTSGHLRLPPVITSKPATPELPPLGKIVRRRAFAKKPLERISATVQSAGPRQRRTLSEVELLRRNSIQAETALVRRSTVDSQNYGSNSSQTDSRPMTPDVSVVRRSVSTGTLRRAKTLEVAPPKRLARRSSLNTKEDSDLARLEAFKALLTSKFEKTTGNHSVVDILSQLTRNVLKYHGTKAFTDESAPRAIATLRQERSSGEVEKEDFLIKALEYMAKDEDMGFLDSVGQILWRSRRADIFKDKPRRKEACEDLSWAVYRSVDDQVGSDVLKSVDDVYDMFENAQKGKGITFKDWQKITKFVEGNPVLKRRVWLTDIDRLWYAATHKSHTDTLLCIGRRAFKELLLTWCDAMNVHPWMVFVAIGSHANDAATTEN